MTIKCLMTQRVPHQDAAAVSQGSLCGRGHDAWSTKFLLELGRVWHLCRLMESETSENDWFEIDAPITKHLFFILFFPCLVVSDSGHVSFFPFICFSRGWSRVWWNLIESSISHSLFLCGGGRQCYDDKLSLSHSKRCLKMKEIQRYISLGCRLQPYAVPLQLHCLQSACICAKDPAICKFVVIGARVRFPFICLVVLFWVQFSGFASCQGALAVLAYPNQQAGESCKAHAILRGYKRLGRSHCLVSSYVLGGCWITLE